MRSEPELYVLLKRFRTQTPVRYGPQRKRSPEQSSTKRRPHGSRKKRRPGEGREEWISIEDIKQGNGRRDVGLRDEG